MLAIIFAVLLFWIAWKTLAIGIRVAWGIARFLIPLFIVIGLIYVGLVYFAVPILIILGVVFLVCHFVKA
jgi:hypothetical protein